ncbi:MAG: T9SS type A sorting domain-containing protein [Chitinophagales bacterium]
MSDQTVLENLEHLSVYPNPAMNSVTIKFPPDSDRDDEAGEISIVNLFGQIVLAEKVIPIAIGTEQKQIDVSRLPAGMYVVSWSSGRNNETKKFSVIK